MRGSDDFSALVDYDLTWRDGARRFEQITLPFQDFAGMAASLELLRELGTRRRRTRTSRRESDELADGARACRGRGRDAGGPSRRDRHGPPARRAAPRANGCVTRG